MQIDLTLSHYICWNKGTNRTKLTDTKINEKCALLKYTINCDNSKAIFSYTAPRVHRGYTYPTGMFSLFSPRVPLRRSRTPRMRHFQHALERLLLRLCTRILHETSV